MGEIKLTNTPYDDVFRTLLNDCSSLIIPVINEVFGENYSGKEEIVFAPNEHFMNRQDGNEDERITDTSFQILGKEVKKYHWECQSSTDNSMVVRLFEYDTQIALDGGNVKGSALTVTFPHSAVLYLRCNSATPDRMKIKMVTPGGSVSYDIPVMKVKRYTAEEIFEKNLLFLIPFYIFTHEERFEEYERDAEKLEALKREYEQIKNRLEEFMAAGVISEYEKCTIMDMSNKVLEHIAQKYEAVRKGVRTVMGGKILEYEAKTILKKGREEGWEAGREEGWEAGREEGVKAFILDNLEEQIPETRILEKLQKRFGLKAEEAEAFFDKYAR